MSENSGKFVTPTEEEVELGFAADKPKGVIKRQTSGGNDRATKAPKDEITKHRDIASTDPHVHEALMTILDWTVGDGFVIRPRTFSDTLQQGLSQLAVDAQIGGGTGSNTGNADAEKAVAAALDALLRMSEFWSVFNDWVLYALIDGHAFMELVVRDGVFKPKLLPTERMARKTDKYGNLQRYELEKQGGGGGGAGGSNAIKYKPHEVAELYFRKDPLEDFGRSSVEPIAEQADMLRDMELDYVRFIATKAYPPILWKLGDEKEGISWTETQIQNWLDTVEAIEPDSMLAAGYDVDYDVVGVTSTSSTAGAMKLEATFDHFKNRIITGLGVPALIMNMEAGARQGVATSAMPSFKRRIRRLQNRIGVAVEQQILRSLMFNSLQDVDMNQVVPEFEFGEYSSNEERLDADTAINLLNNGLLKPEAAARRAGIDPDSELPDIWDTQDLIQVLQALAGRGDNIQNPSGGSPTGTGGGATSSGGEVTTRQKPGSDQSQGRKQKSVTSG